jgi:hypothetical protein
MKYLTGFFAFWYDFIVGDDWTVAAGVIVALAITALLAHNNIAAWWLMPLAVALMLSSSLWRVARGK